MYNGITLKKEARLLVGSLQAIVKRSHIAKFLGVLLVLLTISLAVAGFMTYRNLEEIVIKLETDELSNSNLLQYKEILVNLHDMESHVESYKLTSDPNILEQYNASILRVFGRLDSINARNPADLELHTFNDSLSVLINEKTAVLNKLIDLRGARSDDDLEQLEGFLEEIPAAEPVSEIVTADTIQEEVEEKKGFFKRLLAKKPEPVIETEPTPAVDQDSLLQAHRKEMQSRLSDKVDQIRAGQQASMELKKNREMTLLASHYDIQNRIIDLVTFLEGRETVKFKIRSLKARELAAHTNEQIAIFFSLATILLLSTVVVMVIYVQRNIKYQQLLRASKKSAETIAKAKERFFANMSHELRTPMNAISGFTKVLLKSDLPEEQHEQVGIIHKSSEHLLRLLNDILDFSKLQAEKLQLEEMSFSIKEVCEEGLQLLRDSARRKGLKLTSNLQNLPPFVMGDQHRLKQIILNLLNNGIKYTESGRVSLNASGQMKNNQFTLLMEVKDTGVGISKDHQHRLFREFEQADQSSFSKGTGLGLAITKRLVTLHRGKIRLESTEGKGTSVLIEITYPLASEAPRQIDQDDVQFDFEGLHMLIADDEPFNIKLLGTILKKQHITFDQAGDGSQALELAMQNPYDLMLLDLKMPGLSGWDMARKIRTTDGPNQNTPMIALTATVASLDQDMSTQYGFDQIMRKPFDEVELFATMAGLLHLSVQPSDSPNDEAQQADLSQLFRMGNYEFVQDMVETFIRSAEEGLKELQQAQKNKSYEDLAMISHRIVAPARHFKATILVDLLKQLEHRAEEQDKTISDADLKHIEQALKQVVSSLRKELEHQAAI